MTKNQSQLTVMSLSWEQLDNVPVEQKALYLSLCFLVSELNVLQKISLLTYQSKFDDREFEAIAMIQANTLNRVMSSKCFEIEKFVKDCITRSKNTLVKEICSEYDKKFTSLLEVKGRNVAKYIRDKMAFHFDFGQALKSTSCSIPDDHIDPRRSAFFMAKSILRDIRGGVRTC